MREVVDQTDVNQYLCMFRREQPKYPSRKARTTLLFDTCTGDFKVASAHKEDYLTGKGILQVANVTTRQEAHLPWLVVGIE